MSDNTENKVVDTVIETVVESTSKSKSNSNKALYLIGAGLFALATYVSVKKCYEYMTKKNDE
jgi:hypothetical protein